MSYKKNDLVIVSIEDMGANGEGIGKIEGYTLFVKDGIVGDKVEVRITKTKKQYGYARIEKVLLPSPFRVEPKCQFHRQCGGCQIQALDYEKQLEFKHNKVKNHMIRIGGFKEEFIDSCMEEIIGMEDPYHYRNKAQYPVGKDKNDNIVTGFYAGRTHSIIPNTNCCLGVKENQKILELIIKFMKENNISSYDEETRKGLIRHILIRNGFTSKEIMVCFIMNYRGNKEIGKFIPNQTFLVEKLLEIENITSISVNINTENTNVIMGKETYTIAGNSTIVDTIHVRNMKKESYPQTGESIVFKISPQSFYQVNPIQTEKLYSLALEFAELTGKEIIWDLYCGIGTISLFLAKQAKQVYGVEIVPQAIEDAKENAIRNHITNAEFFVGKAEEVLPEKYKELGIEADIIVVDPPRKGCDQICLDTILKMSPKKIIYVSCDSATLARDAKILCEGGYEIIKMRAVDQFAHTTHVETVCCLQRVNM